MQRGGDTETEVTVKQVPADAKKPQILEKNESEDGFTDLISQYGLSNIGHYKMNYCGSSSGWMNSYSSLAAKDNTEFSGFSHVLPSVENNHCYHADTNNQYESYRNSSGSYLKNDAEGSEKLRIVKAFLIVSYNLKSGDENKINYPVTLSYGGDKEQAPSETFEEKDSNTEEVYLDYFQRNYSVYNGPNGRNENSLGWTDVTDFVNKNRYGWYYCSNIPTDFTYTNEDGSTDWKIVLIEEDESESIPVRYINLKAGARFSPDSRPVIVGSGGDGFKVKDSDNVTGQIFYNFSNIDEPGKTDQYVSISSDNGQTYNNLTVGNRKNGMLCNLKGRNTSPIPMDYKYVGSNYDSRPNEFKWNGNDRVGDDVELLDLSNSTNEGISFTRGAESIAIKFSSGTANLTMNMLGYAVDVDISDEGEDIQNQKTFTQDHSSVDSTYTKGYNDGGKTIEVNGNAETFPKDNDATRNSTDSYIKDGRLVITVDNRYEIVENSVIAKFYNADDSESGTTPSATVNATSNTITIPYGKGDDPTTVNYDHLNYSFLIKAKDRDQVSESQKPVENSAALSGVPYNNGKKIADAYYRYKTADTTFDLTIDPGKGKYSGETEVKELSPVQTVSLSNPVPDDPDYEFVGWKAVNGGYLAAVNGTSLEGNDYVTVNPTDNQFKTGLQDTTLQAVYRHKPITVTKKWDDQNNLYQKRPDQVTVHLMKNSQEAAAPLVLSEGNNWTGTFDNISAADNEQDEVYSVTEDQLDSYEENPTVTDDAKNGFTITNHAIPPEIKPVETDNLEILKVLKGDDPGNNKVFTFDLKVKDENQVMPEESVDGVKKVTINQAGTVSFGTWQYTAPGTYEYEISEENLGKEGYTYDSQVYTLTDTVSEDYTSGQLSYTRTIKDQNGNPVNQAVFTNTYEKTIPSPTPSTTASPTPLPTPEVTPSASPVPTFSPTPSPVSSPETITVGDPPVRKTITGDKTSDQSVFRFTMRADNPAYPMPEGSENGIKTVSHQGAGSIEFGDITFREPGTYTYSISEENDQIAGYQYDKGVFQITYVIIRNDDGSLSSARTITRDGNQVDQAEFVNHYTAKKENQNKPSEKNTPVKKHKDHQAEKKAEKSPDTGDHSYIWLYAGVMTLMIGIAGMVIYLRKKSEN